MIDHSRVCDEMERAVAPRLGLAWWAVAVSAVYFLAHLVMWAYGGFQVTI